MPSSTRRAQLEAWLIDDVAVRFHGRILPIGIDIADRWGRITALAKKSGNSLPYIDSLLAATAVHHNLTLVTRDTSRLNVTGVTLFNPWST